MPNTHRRRDETVLSRRRRRCVHEFATSWRQFRRVVGVNTPVGSRDPYGCFVSSHRRIRRQSSRIHVHTADATRRDSTVSSRRRRRCVLGIRNQLTWISRRGRSRSYILTAIESPCTTLYRPLIVTLIVMFALSSTVSEILPVFYAPS